MFTPLVKAPGSTSVIVEVFIESAYGVGVTGLAFGTALLVAYFKRDTAALATAITLVTATLGTWSSGGFKEVDATNQPGVYEVGIPDAALASGAGSVMLTLKGAAGMLTAGATIQLGVELSDAGNLAVTEAVLTSPDTIETGFSLRDAVAVNAASAAGVLSGANTTAVTIRDLNNSLDRISATVDNTGNRTAVVYDLS